MANLQLLDLAETLQFKAPGAPFPHLVTVLRMGIREFCMRSRAYIFRFDPISSSAGEFEYDLGLPRGTEVLEEGIVRYDGRPIDPGSESLLDGIAPGWQDRPGKPSHYYITDGLLMLAPAPQESLRDAITGNAILTLSNEARTVDSTFYNRNSAAIMDFTLHLLFAEKDKPWGDMGMSTLHFNRALAAAEDAQYRARNQNTQKRETVAYGG